MSIATAITAAQGRVADAYTAVSAKGGTLPATQNLANLPTAINSITSGGVPTYMAPKANINGLYQPDNTATTFTVDGATDVYTAGLAYAFYGCTNLTSIDISSITQLTNSLALDNTFNGCTGLTTADLSGLTLVSGSQALWGCFFGCSELLTIDISNLQTVSGGNACFYAFYGCTKITSVDLSALETISGASGCAEMFNRCTNLASVNLSSLKTITGSSACSFMFGDCTSLTSLSFPAITTTSFGTRTNQFRQMCNRIPNITLHFPSNVQSVIEGLDEYSTTAPFGATAGTVLFDLPATE